MKSPLLRALIIGAPASGKGTISNRVIKHFDVKHLSSGDVLRRHIVDKTDLGATAESYIARGALVPDGVMISLIASELKNLNKCNWILDGFPRTKYQAEELHSLQPVNLVLNLIVPFEVIIQRVAQRWIHAPSGRIYNTEFSPPKVEGIDDITGEDLIQRPDDRPEAVQIRLNAYSKMIEPVLQFYEELKIVKNFHGRTSDEIWPQVYNLLTNYLEPSKKIVSQDISKHDS